MNKQLLPKAAVLATGAGALLCTAAYFGLSAYAANVAEQRITATLNELGVPSSSYRWASLSSSPLGGTLTIEGLDINHDTSNGRGQRFLRLSAEQLVVEGLDGSGIPEQASISLEGVEIPSVRGDNRERNELYQNLDSSVLMKFARAGGRDALQPFDVTLAWELEDKAANIDWSTTQPELIRAHGQQLITGPLPELLSFASASNLQQTPPLFLLGQLTSLGAQLGLKEIQLEVEDLGGIARSNQLGARYDLANGRVQALEEAQGTRLQQVKTGCEQNLQPVFVNADACERLAEFVVAERSAVQFSAAGKTPLTFQEAIQLNPRSVGYLKDKFSPRID